MNFSDIKNKLVDLKARRSLLAEELSGEQQKHIEWKTKHETALKARTLIQQTALKTQKNIEGRITRLVTPALLGVLEDDPHEFLCEFVLRRNSTECDLYFVKNGQRMRTMNSTGGGAIGIASLAARPAFATFRPSRRIIISDEPLVGLSDSYHLNASKMLKMILGTKDKSGRPIIEQMIMVTHLDKLAAEADNVIDIVEARKNSKPKRSFKRE
jgi:hypothetical protein